MRSSPPRLRHNASAPGEFESTSVGHEREIELFFETVSVVPEPAAVLCSDASTCTALDRIVAELEAVEDAALLDSHAADFAWAKPDVAYLNHGGLGGPPRAIRAIRSHLEEVAERQPMFWHRECVPRLATRARRAVASYLRLEDAELVHLVQNVSTALFAVMRAAQLVPGDVVLTTDVRYHAVDDALGELCRRSGAALVTVTLPLEGFVSREAFEEAVLDAWLEGLESASKLGPIKLAVFDHVSSKPSAVFPVEAMAAECASRGVPTLVDGAHAPGLLPHAEQRVCGDFYAVNFHKWALAPRPAAALICDAACVARRFPWMDAAGLDARRPAASFDVDAISRGVYDESTRHLSAPRQDQFESDEFRF